MLVRGEMFPGPFFVVDSLKEKRKEKKTIKQSLEIIFFFFSNNFSKEYNNLVKLLRTVVILFHAGIV
jgi:hypothetical protein